MATYKVSCVVIESQHPGAILNLEERPQVGNTIKLGDKEFLILEIMELMPPRDDFYFLHITCKPLP